VSATGNKVLIVYNSNVHLTVLIAIQPTAGCQSKTESKPQGFGFRIQREFPETNIHKSDTKFEDKISIANNIK